MNCGNQGRKILIVGASKGIGRAIALEFAKEKANVIAIARSKELLESLEKECLELGASSFNYEVMDITLDNRKELTKKLLDKYGHFDVVVHAVGTSLVSRNINGGYKDWEEALRVNALASIDMNSIIIPHMIENNIKGHIIHISSISGHYLRGNPLYASSKAFLNAYVTTAGRELASKGITLNAVMPGAVAFNGSYWDKLIKDNDPKCNDFLKHHQAIGRFGSPEEIAPLVVFLASDKSTFMPGAVIDISGGNM